MFSLAWANTSLQLIASGRFQPAAAEPAGLRIDQLAPSRKRTMTSAVGETDVSTNAA
jgi:hypothetical protein